jgi:hypothetical protein
MYEELLAKSILPSLKIRRIRTIAIGMAAHVTAASVHDFKLFSYFFEILVLSLEFFPSF